MALQNRGAGRELDGAAVYGEVYLGVDLLWQRGTDLGVLIGVRSRIDKVRSSWTALQDGGAPFVVTLRAEIFQPIVENRRGCLHCQFRFNSVKSLQSSRSIFG
jgi:hypothetical protein